MSRIHRICSRCDAPLDAAARYCHRCGRGVATSGALRHRRAWVASGLIVLASTVLAIAAARGPTPTVPDMAGGQAASGTIAPDISGLTPRERFDRLYARVMAAAEAGDTAEVVRFTDHAMFAYAQLDRVDADARYHFAVLAAQIEQYDVALAVADTILATTPDHLFGYLIQGSVAERMGNAALFRKAQAGFLAAWPTARLESPEYRDHWPALEDFRMKAGAPERSRSGS